MRITPISDPWRPMTDLARVLPTPLQRPLDKLIATMLAGPGCIYKDIHPFFKQYAPEIYLSAFVANTVLFESFAPSFGIFSFPMPVFFVAQLAFTGTLYARMMIELSIIKNELLEYIPPDSLNGPLKKGNLSQERKYVSLAWVLPSQKAIYNQIIHLFRKPWSQVHNVLAAVGIAALSLEFFSTSLLVASMRLIRYLPFFILMSVKFHHSAMLSNLLNDLQHWVNNAPLPEKETRQEAQARILNYLKEENLSLHQYLIEGGVKDSINRFFGFKLCGETPTYKINFSGLGLTSLPDILWELKTAYDIDLSNNKLTTFPPQIQKFLYLRKLNIKGNPWEDLPDELRGYPNSTFPNLHTVLLDAPKQQNENDIPNNAGIGSKCAIM